ncbi:hypothetical protein D3C76_383830 [compost metagenome]
MTSSFPCGLPFAVILGRPPAKLGANAAPGKSMTIRSGLLIFVIVGFVAPETAMINRFSVKAAPFTKGPAAFSPELPGTEDVCGVGVGLGEGITLPAVVPLFAPGVVIGVGEGVLVAEGSVTVPSGVAT